MMTSGLLPRRLGILDPFGNVYGASCLKLVRLAFAGALARLRRVSDNVESDFSVGGDGWIDAAAITTWLGGSSARVVSMYDQSGNGRHWTQPTAGTQPFLDLSASHPRLDWQGAQSLIGTSTLAGFLNNRSGVTVAHVRKHDASPAVSTPDTEVYFTVTASGQNRFVTSLRTSGNLELSTRLTDGGGATNTNVAEDALAWRTHVGRADYAGGERKGFLDTATGQSTGLTTGSSSATDSQQVYWGARGGSEFLEGYSTGLFLFTEALSDAKIALLVSLCESLKAP